MMNLFYQPNVLADLRLRMLETLKDLPGYTANETVLRTALRLQGHAVGVEQLRIELAWCGQVAAAVHYHVNGDLWVAQLTDLGVDVAHGLLALPGIGINNLNGKNELRRQETAIKKTPISRIHRPEPRDFKQEFEEYLAAHRFTNQEFAALLMTAKTI